MLAFATTTMWALALVGHRPTRAAFEGTMLGVKACVELEQDTPFDRVSTARVELVGVPLVGTLRGIARVDTTTYEVTLDDEFERALRRRRVSIASISASSHADSALTVGIILPFLRRPKYMVLRKCRV